MKEKEASSSSSPSIDPLDSNPTEDQTKPKKKRGYTLIPWFFSRKLIENDTFTSHDQNESFMHKMVTTAVDDNVVDKIPMETMNNPETPVSERGLLDPVDTKRTSNGSDMSEYSSPYEKQHINTTGESSLQPYPSSSASSAPPMLPSHYVSLSDNNPADLNTISDMLHREKERSSNLEARSIQLSDRVEELEVILSEYFINVGYLDQLRSRKKAKLIAVSGNHIT